MTPASNKCILMDMVSTMDKLFDMLLRDPRAVLESGVAIPCSLRSALELEDDEALRVSELPVDNLLVIN